MSSPALPSALDHFDELGRLGSGRVTAFFLDYDGTLVGLKSRPELAVMSEATHALLASLSERYLVCILSGRGLEDLRASVGLDKVYYAASHGHEVEGPRDSGVHLQRGLEFSPSLSTIARSLQERLAWVEGLVVEPKGLSVAVHYRLVPPSDLKAVERAVKRMAGAHPELRLSSGKRVYEFTPALDWDKGKALVWLLGTLGISRGRVFPICLGDDLTDEDAFVAVKDWGASIAVGELHRATAASYWLRDPTEVVRFLGLFAERVPAQGHQEVKGAPLRVTADTQPTRE